MKVDKGVEMYRIGEFSRIAEMTVKALRYYDDIDLLKPAMINEENGYRYYDETNYSRAVWIRTLKKYGFSIKEIQDVIVNIHSDDDLADYLLEKQDHIQAQIASMRKIQQQIGKEIRTLKEVRRMTTEQKVEIIDVPDLTVAGVRYKGKYEDVGKYFGILYKAVGAKGISEPFSMYHDDSFMEENADVEVCVEVKSAINKGEVTTKTVKGGKFITMIHVGPYDRLSETYKTIADYVNENGLETKSPCREIYLKGPGMLFKGNPEKYETKVMMPLI